MSRHVVRPARRVVRALWAPKRAASGGVVVRRASSQCTPNWSVRWVWRSMSPGSRVASPRSRTGTPGGTLGRAPTSRMRSPETRTKPGEIAGPPRPSQRRAASRRTSPRGPRGRGRREHAPGRGLPGMRLVPQGAGDLGARMEAAFSRSFRRGARRVALIGTDTPGLTREIVIAALDALDDVDVVLGPAEDGGYYLLALRRPHPELFAGVVWSTATVPEGTRGGAAAGGP